MKKIEIILMTIIYLVNISEGANVNVNKQVEIGKVKRFTLNSNPLYTAFVNANTSSGNILDHIPPDYPHDMKVRVKKVLPANAGAIFGPINRRSTANRTTTKAIIEPVLTEVTKANVTQRAIWNSNYNGSTSKKTSITTVNNKKTTRVINAAVKTTANTVTKVISANVTSETTQESKQNATDIERGNDSDDDTPPTIIFIDEDERFGTNLSIPDLSVDEIEKKSTKDDKDTNMNPSRRLIAARDADIEDYPYVVSIQKGGVHWCSGSLLNPRLIITTANCLWKSNQISRLRVRAGSRYTDRGGQTAKIQEVMKHPGWSLRKNPENDVALLLIDRTLRFSHSCHGLDLPNNLMLPPFDDAWVTSFGSNRRDGVYDKHSQTLQVYHGRWWDRDKCNNVTQRFGITVTKNFICLAQSGKRAPCTRDTGAPAVSDGVLWGMASWGIRSHCGTERYPAVFSYVASVENQNFLVNATYSLMSQNRVRPFPDAYRAEEVVHTTETTTPFIF